MEFKKHTQAGAAMVEYGLLLCLIAVVAITAISNVGDKVNAIFDSTNTALSAPSPQTMPPP